LSELYYAYIKPVTHVAYKVVFQKVDAFRTWHDRLGHPSIRMMHKIIRNSNGHELNTAKFPKSSNFMCTSCAIGKLILCLSPIKIQNEPLKFLERIQGDICGPIQPTSRPFIYFMVLIDASTRWSHVCLLSTRNHAFKKLLLELLNLEHIILNIKFNQFEWTMLLNFAQRL